MHWAAFYVRPRFRDLLPSRLIDVSDSGGENEGRE
jgi:hypothetical protein